MSHVSLTDLPSRPSQQQLCTIVDHVFDADLKAKASKETVDTAKAYIVQHMQRHGLGHARGDRAEAYLQVNPASVKIADGVTLPPRFTKRAPDNKAIIAAHKENELPDGVTVTQTMGVRFKPVGSA